MRETFRQRHAAVVPQEAGAVRAVRGARSHDMGWQ